MITYFVYLNTPVDATQWGVVSDQVRFYFYPKNINTIPSRSIFKTEVTVFYHTDRDLAGK